MDATIHGRRSRRTSAPPRGPLLRHAAGGRAGLRGDIRDVAADRRRGDPAVDPGLRSRMLYHALLAARSCSATSAGAGRAAARPSECGPGASALRVRGWAPLGWADAVAAVPLGTRPCVACGRCGAWYLRHPARWLASRRARRLLLCRASLNLAWIPFDARAAACRTSRARCGSCAFRASASARSRSRRSPPSAASAPRRPAAG